MRTVVFCLFVIVGPLLLLAPVLGLLVQPWAPFWLGQQRSLVPVGTGSVAVPAIGPVAPPVISGARVSDAERYALAIAAGFTPAQAIIATALSIAEDGSGDPAILSAPNRDGSRDLGLWQINSQHWPDYGGHDALVVPINNARAAFAIAGPHLNWCAWSTYEVACGPGHTGSYRAFLARAAAAAHTSEPTLSIASTTPLFSQTLQGAQRGYLTDYPGVPDMLTLWTSLGMAGVSLQRNCTLSQGVRSGANVMVGYSAPELSTEGQTLWVSVIDAIVPPDEPLCEARLDQWIGPRPCLESNGMCDIAAVSRP